MAKIEVKMEENEVGVTKYLYLIIFLGNIMAFCGDLSMMWSSPVLPKLNSTDPDINPLGKPITSEQESWIGSLNSMGAMISLYPMCLLADIIGRKYTLILLALPHFIAFMLYAFSKNISCFYVGRFLNGMAISGHYVVFPMYVAEITPDASRGFMLVSYSIFSSLGAVFVYSVGPYLSIMTFDIILAIFPALFIISFLLIAPESPYYHVIKNDYISAETSLRKVRFKNYDKIDEEMKIIQAEVDKTREGKVLDTLKTKFVIKGATISIFITTFQQLSGYAAFMSYTQNIFEDAGSDLSADVSSIIIGLVFFIGGCCGTVLVDRIGRKPLLYCSVSGILFSEILLAIYYTLRDNSISVASITWLPILCLMVFVFMYQVGTGPLPLTITSEILPVNVKFFIATTAGLISWVASFLVTKFFNALNDSLGQAGTIWLFAGLMLILLIFIYFWVPETKGKSFEEIQNELKNDKNM